MSRAAAHLASRLEGLEHSGVKLGLERIEALLAALGDPHLRLTTVLIAGTNGKGSTAAALASIATAAGYRTGLYTSPHLESVEERIRVDGVEIETADLVDRVEEVLAVAGRLADDAPTYFETLTAAALCHFDRAEVDLAILEVGMGGRLDATNASRPILSLITSIGLDHQRRLGATTATIAREKAGILRAGRPALAVVSEEPVRAVLARRASEIGAELELLPAGSLVASRSARPRRGQRLEIESGSRSYHLETRLEGAHQASNLALAVRASETLEQLGFERIDRAAIERGIARVRWPGRLEWVELPHGGEVLLDAAHNGAGWEALDAYLENVGEPFELVFGVLRDKLGADGARGLLGRAESVVLTTPPSERALPPEELVDRVPGRAEIVRDPAEAVARASRGARLLVVCGSLYLIGAARRELRRSWGRPPRYRELFSLDTP